MHGTSESEGTRRRDARTDESDELDPFDLTIESTELESEFRDATARSHRRQVRLGLAVLCLPMAVFTVSDILFFGVGPRFYFLLALRSAVVLGAITVARIADRARDVSRVDAALLAWWLLCAVALTTIDASRPARYVLHIAIDVLYVLSAYVVPARSSVQVAAASAVTLGTASVIITLKTNLETTQIVLVIVSFAYANLFGFLLSRHLHVGARELFVAHLRERRARSTLRALTRFVPMCASCKSVKGSSGEWHKVEEYLHAETGHDVTHGLCPSCVRRLYPDLADRILSASDGATRPPASRDPSS